MKKVIDILPQAIGMYGYPYNEQLYSLIQKTIETEEEVSNINSPQLKHYGNKVNAAILDQPQYKKFKEWVEKCAEDFCVNVLGYELTKSMVCVDSWVNVCDKDGDQYQHFHNNCFISGCYYVKYDPKKDSPIIFRHIKNSNYAVQQVLSLEPSKMTKYNGDSSVYPDEGTLVLWESHLSHGVPPNPKDGRISIAMNFLPKVFYSANYGFEINGLTKYDE